MVIGQYITVCGKYHSASGSLELTVLKILHHYDGIAKLLQYPEYSDTAKFRNLLGVLEEKDKILDVISSHTTTEDGINVYIGNEDSSDAMKDTTLIFKNVTVGGKQLAVGVIGPKRMNYSKVVSSIEYFSKSLSKMFRDKNRESKKRLKKEMTNDERKRKGY